MTLFLKMQQEKKSLHSNIFKLISEISLYFSENVIALHSNIFKLIYM